MNRWLDGWIGKNNEKEGNGLFHDTFNTFYLQLYGITYVKKPLR